MEEINLNRDRVITLPVINGEMDIEIKAGRIRAVRSDCPQRVCVNTGWIQYAGQTIVCVPNRVLVEVKSAGSPFLDAVCY